MVVRKEPLEARVHRAAEAALQDHHYISAIDVLCGMRLLEPTHVDAWRKGRIAFLEEVVQGSPNKISESIRLLQAWPEAKGLKPRETRYVRSTREGEIDLRFSRSGAPEIERVYRTHYVSPELPARQREKLQERLERPPQPVVFDILRDSQCSECGAELEPGSFLYQEAGQALCLACARLDHLEYLPAGDAALTRRASKYSQQAAVVVRFSRSRGRYERQGILVEIPALERAEQECAADAGQRAAARARGAAQRRAQDRALVDQMTDEIRMLFPGCPREEASRIAAHTALRGSGRVGRSAAGRKLEEQALTAAVVAAVRHRHTNYDQLLAEGCERARARERVSGEVQEILEKWRGGQS